MAKTKALISFAAKLICVLFSHMEKSGFLTTRLIYGTALEHYHGKPNCLTALLKLEKSMLSLAFIASSFRIDYSIEDI